MEVKLRVTLAFQSMSFIIREILNKHCSKRYSEKKVTRVKLIKNVLI